MNQSAVKTLPEYSLGDTNIEKLTLQFFNSSTRIIQRYWTPHWLAALGADYCYLLESCLQFKKLIKFLIKCITGIIVMASTILWINRTPKNSLVELPTGNKWSRNAARIWNLLIIKWDKQKIIKNNGKKLSKHPKKNVFIQ